MADIQHCIDAVQQRFADLSEADLKAYIGEVQHRVKSEGLSYDAAIKAVGDDNLKRAIDSAKSIAETERKAAVLIDKVRHNKATLRSLMVRIYSKRQNLGDNVESATKAHQNTLASALFNKLSEVDYQRFYQGGDDTKIAAAFDGHGGDVTHQKIANALKQFHQQSDYLLLRSGAYTLDQLHPKRFFKAVHDPVKLLGKNQGLIKNLFNRMKKQTPTRDEAREQWKSFILPLLDKDATFAKSSAVDEAGAIDDDRIDAILNTVYNNIVTRRSDSLLNNAVPTDIDTVLKKRHLFFVWKDMRSYLHYSNEYGAGGLYPSAMRDLHSVSRRAGLSDLFGSVPSYTYNRIVKAEPEKVEQSNAWYQSNANIFKTITGQTSVPENPTLAALGANLRSITGMAANGGLFFSSLSDVNIAASFLSQSLDTGYLKGFMQSLSGLWQQYTDDETKSIAKMLHLSLQHEIGYIGRFVDANNLSSVMSKTNRLFYKAIGMQMKDEGHRVGVVAAMSRLMARDKDIAFKSLPAKRQAFLHQLNINSDEWNLYRRHINDKYWHLDSLKSISDDELKTLRDKQYGVNSEVPLSQIRVDLHRKLHAFFDVGADHAILNPGWYEQAMMAQGTKPGTFTGEAVRCFMQFKGFLISYWNRVLYGGFTNAANTNAKLVAALENFGYVLPLSFLSDYFYNLGQGQSTPALQDASIKDIINWSAPGLGVFLRMLDTSHQNSDLVWSILKTPSLKTLGDIGAVPLRLLSGDGKGATRELGKATSDVLPLARVPVLNPYVQAALGQQPFHDKGQQVLYGSS